MKFLLALVGLFLCFNASAEEMRDVPVFQQSLKIVCTDKVEDAIYNVTVARQHVEVFHKTDMGGGTLRLYQNMQTGDWVLLRFVDRFVCFIAAGKPEVGS